MRALSYEQLIMEGIKGLPPEKLVQVLDFVSFMRMKAARPEALSDELYASSLRAELRHLSRSEREHLEGELSDDGALHPGE